MDSCKIPDCPLATGGKCWNDLPLAVREPVRELRVIRALYDEMESLGELDDMEEPPCKFVTWRGWKMIRNPISDRIETLTGGSRI